MIRVAFGVMETLAFVALPSPTFFRRRLVSPLPPATTSLEASTTRNRASSVTTTSTSKSSVAVLETYVPSSATDRVHL